MIAYCWKSGQIEIGKRVPDGALPIIKGTRKFLESTIHGTATLAYDNKTWLVPGIRTSSDPLQALLDYTKWLTDRKPKTEVAA